MSRRALFFTVVVACVTGACAWTWKPIPYAPNALKGVDAREIAATLIKSNTRQGCVTETEFSGAMLNVQFVCTTGLGNASVRFDQVERISLQTAHDWYMVRVEHAAGVEPFEWSSKVRSDMERLADALHTLAQLGSQSMATDRTL